MRSTRVIVIGLAALLAAGYAIHAYRDFRLRDKWHIPGNASIRDLGEVELSSATPKLLPLGNGDEVTITANLVTNEAQLVTVPATMTNGVLQIAISYHSKKGLSTTKPGETVTVERRSFMHPRDRPLAVTFAKESPNPVAVLLKLKLIP